MPARARTPAPAFRGSGSSFPTNNELEPVVPLTPLSGSITSHTCTIFRESVPMATATAEILATARTCARRTLSRWEIARRRTRSTHKAQAVRSTPVLNRVPMSPSRIWDHAARPRRPFHARQAGGPVRRHRRGSTIGPVRVLHRQDRRHRRGLPDLGAECHPRGSAAWAPGNDGTALARREEPDERDRDRLGRVERMAQAEATGGNRVQKKPPHGYESISFS